MYPKFCVKGFGGSTSSYRIVSKLGVDCLNVARDMPNPGICFCE